MASAGIRKTPTGRYKVWWRLDDGSQGSQTFDARDSLIGVLTLVASDGALSGLYMEEHLHVPDRCTFGRPSAGASAAASRRPPSSSGSPSPDSARASPCACGLRMRAQGSDLQRRVWQAVVAAIADGQTEPTRSWPTRSGGVTGFAWWARRTAGTPRGRGALPPGRRRRRRPHRVCRWAGPQAGLLDLERPFRGPRPGRRL